MGLSEEKKHDLIQIIKHCLYQKFRDYRPESKHMPFHYRLLGKDRMALFSFIHSINTTFGTSIYEPVAIELASGRFAKAQNQISPYNEISIKAQGVIQEIIDDLTSVKRAPDYESEFEEIRMVCQAEPTRKIKSGLVDIRLEDAGGKIYLIELKTVKPNIEGFIGHKRKLLEWIAQELLKNSEAKVQAMIGIPYNPYEPKPYERWTMQGMFDLSKEIKVAGELWNFIGGEGAYLDLLDCFERAGLEMRPEIDQYFSRFK